MSGQENATRQLKCPACGSELPPGTTDCRVCGAKAPPPETTEHREMPVEAASRGHRHSQHGHSVRASKRYVYGKRKERLSAEVIWLLLVIILGLLLILGAHLLAFMRARKLVQAPSAPAAVVRCCCSTGMAEAAWGGHMTLEVSTMIWGNNTVERGRVACGGQADRLSYWYDRMVEDRRLACPVVT